MAISDFFVGNWWLIFGGIFGGVWFFFYTWKRSATMQRIDGPAVAAPADLRRRDPQGDHRALVPHALDHVRRRRAAGGVARLGGGRGGQLRLLRGHQAASRREVSTGTGLTVAMQNTNVFPNMVLQMCAIGEESGALDAMLSKVADFFEQEVDDAVDALSSLMEPMIMVVLGGLIGGIVVAMYLPIFKMGQAI